MIRGSTRGRYGVVVLSILCLGVAACSASAGTAAPAGPATPGGTVTFAEQPGNPPAYIFPLSPSSHTDFADLPDFQYLMYEPLYSVGQDGKAVLNQTTSIAYPPSYSAGDTVVTVKLKPYKWSDGRPVTSRDVQFWMNVLSANKADFGQYSPGAFPDDVKSTSYPSASEVVFTLKHAVNPTWFTDNELTQVIPIPQQSWDKTSAGGAVGNADMSPAGAKAVYNFLNSQALQLSTYATNPLWQTVDGPFRLKAFTTTGQATLVPNRSYSGPAKARIGELVELPFTTEQSEFNALRAGTLDYGYLPLTDVSQVQALQAQGFSVKSWPVVGTTYVPINANNPTVGPIFRQLYIRQAMTRLINQPEYLKDILDGYGSVDYGPIPAVPKNSYATASASKPLYPYDPQAAKSLLTSHGWLVHPGGISVCDKPGDGASECGAGIKKGAQLSFTLLYSSGIEYMSSEVQAMKTAFAAAGIDLNLASAPTSQVISESAPCSGGSACNFQMVYWASPSWTYANANFYPTGEEIFAGGGGANSENYNDPTNNANILATQSSSSPQVLSRYESYLTQQVPVLWLPNAPHEIAVVKNTLSGALPLDPYGQISPQLWELRK